MGGVRLSTRTDLKNDIMELYNGIETNDTNQALRCLQSAKKNTIIYYNTRGVDCSKIIPIFTETHNLLNKNFLQYPRKSNMAKNKLYGYLFKLNKALKFGITENGLEFNERDPAKVLKELSEDLVDDYSEFTLSAGQELVDKNRRILDLVRNDLLEIRELEPLIRNKSQDLIEKYNALVKCSNLCLMILPQVKDATVSANTQTKFRTYFESLFNVFTDILVPVDVSSTQNVQVKKQKKPEVQAEIKKELPKETKEELVEKTPDEKKPEETPEEKPDENKEEEQDDGQSVDLEELERMAREGTLGDSHAS